MGKRDQIKRTMMGHNTARGSPAALSMLNYVNTFAYIANVAVTYVSMTGAFGPTNAALSNKYQTLVTPAGWAFAIWGPIFIWEGIAVIAQLLPSYRDSGVVNSIGYWWMGACIAQVVWTPVFAQEIIWLSLVCMLSILVCLVGVAYQVYHTDSTIGEYWLLAAPFALHLGWIVAASIVNCNVVVVAYYTAPVTRLATAVVSLAVASAAGVFACTLTKPNCFVSGVLSWALGAIAFELSGRGGPEFVKIQDQFPDMVTNSLSTAAAVLSVAFGAATVAQAAITAVKRWRGPIISTTSAAQPLM